MTAKQTFPARHDFLRVATLQVEATVLLTRILAATQRDSNLRPIADKVFKLLADQLAFAARFERDLVEATNYVDAWQVMTRELGKPPDRDIFEMLLAGVQPGADEDVPPVDEPAEPPPAAEVTSAAAFDPGPPHPWRVPNPNEPV